MDVYARQGIWGILSRPYNTMMQASSYTQRDKLNFVVTNVGSVVDDSSNDATVICINGANTCIPFVLCTGVSDPISLTRW